MCRHSARSDISAYQRSSLLEILLVTQHSYSLHIELHPHSCVRATSLQPFESVAETHVETPQTSPRTCSSLMYHRFFIPSCINLRISLPSLKFFISTLLYQYSINFSILCTFFFAIFYVEINSKTFFT